MVISLFYRSIHQGLLYYVFCIIHLSVHVHVLFHQPLMITLLIHSLPALILWGRCSWKHLFLFQYLRVVLWLIGQGLLPEQSGKDVYRYSWSFPYRNLSNTAPLLYYGQFPMCQQNFHSSDIFLQVLQWKNLLHTDNLWIDWRFVVVCFSFF